MEALFWGYVAALAIVGACFLDAPLRAVRLTANARRLDCAPYWVANGLAVLLGLAWLAAIAWPRFESELAPLPIPFAFRIVGVMLALTGAAWAAWSRITLSAEFLPTAAVRPGANLVVRGPFRFMRHPFYAGAWLVMAAGTLALASLASAVAALVMLPLLQVLARGEERLLRAAYGPDYAQYCDRVGRFLPRL